MVYSGGATLIGFGSRIRAERAAVVEERAMVPEREVEAGAVQERARAASCCNIRGDRLLLGPGPSTPYPEAMDACQASLLDPGDPAIVGVNRHFGERRGRKR